MRKQIRKNMSSNRFLSRTTGQVHIKRNCAVRLMFGNWSGLRYFVDAEHTVERTWCSVVCRCWQSTRSCCHQATTSATTGGRCTAPRTASAFPSCMTSALLQYCIVCCVYTVSAMCAPGWVDWHRSTNQLILSSAPSWQVGDWMMFACTFPMNKAE